MLHLTGHFNIPEYLWIWASRRGVPPCTFYHPHKHICTTVHGDDFVSEGTYKSLKWMDDMLRKHFEVKTETMGEGLGLVKEMRLLNRLVTWTTPGIMWEPDPRHCETVLRELGLDGNGVTSVVTPGEKGSVKQTVATQGDGPYLCAECGSVHCFGELPTESCESDVPVAAPSGKQDFLGMLRDPEIGKVDRSGAGRVHGMGDKDVAGVATELGWQQTGANTWSRSILGATGMPLGPASDFSRRIVRDVDSGVLIDDLWTNSRTPDRLVRRSFKVPRNIDVVVEVANVETQSEGTALTWEEQEMSSRDATAYRAVTARLNFISPDRPDLQFSCKEASRRMAKPCNGDWQPLKAIAMYILGKPRIVHIFSWQELLTHMSVYVDSNWAGCVRTRKSTTGVAIVHGKHLIRSFSRTQSSIALSSAEAELYAMVSAASEGMGARAMVKDYGGQVGINLFVDASAAIGVAQRKGLGRIRHLDTQALWIQDAVRQQKVALNKSKGTQNPADMMTEFLGSQDFIAMMEKLGLESVPGRPIRAPKVAVDGGL